jgi:glycosyltransferase involved in cell wall biosynthesis
VRVLFMAGHRLDRSPSQRFRFEQYLPHLRARGIDCDFSPLLSERDDKIFYSPGRVAQKARIGLSGLARRALETSRFSLPGRYQAVYVQREAFFALGPIFEHRAARRVPLVFDFDDAIWVPGVSEANKHLAFLKAPDRTLRLLPDAALVLAGNEYLADFARRYARRVEIVPTTIDTDEYAPLPSRPERDMVCVGWSGSFSTIQHFELARPVLRRLQQRLGAKVRFKVIGDPKFRDDELGIVGEPWRKATEVQDLLDIDVGIMPLPDDEWARGKCGLKGLQYMALEIPAIMSPVGVNTQIIADGVDGFTPRSDDEWLERLVLLVEDRARRLEMGRRARKTVVDRYSVHAWKDRYVELFRSLR